MDLVIQKVLFSNTISIDKKCSSSFIQFWGEKSRFSNRRFNLNCDTLLNHGWQQRWKELNKEDYHDGQALEQMSDSLEKARNLYPIND